MKRKKITFVNRQKKHFYNKGKHMNNSLLLSDIAIVFNAHRILHDFSL
jgi:hypothetical protein